MKGKENMKTTHIQMNNLVWFRRLVCAVAVILLIVAVIQHVPGNTHMAGKRPPPRIMIQHTPNDGIFMAGRKPPPRIIVQHTPSDTFLAGKRPPPRIVIQRAPSGTFLAGKRPPPKIII